MKFENSKLEKGRISFVGKNQYKILTESEELTAYIKGSLRYSLTDFASFPTVGDWVIYQKIDNNHAMIFEILSRKNKISRKVSGLKVEEQILATNVDYVLICLSLNENFNLNRLERYLFAFDSDVKPIIVLTKKDLCEDPEKYVEQIRKDYPDLRIEVVSAINREFQSLKEIFSKGTTCVLIGSSGVGKSTLVNTFFDKEVLRTGSIYEKTSKGKHTTTARQLVVLPNNQGYLIDTPGIRELSVWDTDEGEDSFKDIRELAKQCRFKNCHHISEPDCAIKKAIETGKLSRRRYENYLKLHSEEEYIKKEKGYQKNQIRNKKIRERENAKKARRLINK